ncbi:uncharacterized protein LOC119079565 [Bradysia coprophila]|uniref:uncharacterized protein LOC119079565 n=1 Tax=Bradysia coprophila TaxID=38358 RepID=UPI00187DC3ED|nr:uncharacterized protein LOC119079565 [Bradysia coprophila]
MDYYFNCFILKFLISLTTTAHTMKVDEEGFGFCAAVNSILSGGIFSSPLHIQFMDGTLHNCLIPTHTTYFVTNVCASATTAPIAESSLILVKAEQLLQINFDCIDSNGYLLIVIRNELNQSFMNELVSILWKKSFINVTFVTMKNSKIFLQTFLPFNDLKCDDVEPKVINKFDENRRKWENDQFFPEKLHNFHSCRLTVTTYKNVVPYIVREEYINGKRILTGRVIEMIDALASTLNFTTQLDYHPSISAYETCIRIVANRKADLFIGNLFLDLSRTSYVDFTIPIFFEFLKFAVPPGRSYTQFENLSRTFDSRTWVLILCVLLSCTIIVFSISISSKDIKIDAFGTGYDNGFMDFIADTLGMSRISMPNFTIPRMIIVKFVIFSFVIRTLYQASLFKFLNSNGKLKSAQSIEEIIDRGYAVYSLTLYENYLNLSHHSFASRKFVNLSDFDVLLEKISNANFKGALMHTGSLLMYNNGLKDRKFTNVFCKEDFMTISMVAYLPKNSYLTEVVNEKIGLFHNAGLIDIWDRRSKNTTQTIVEEENSLKDLSVSDLKAIFQLYLMALSLSIVMFIGEIVYENVKRQIKIARYGIGVEC